MGRTFNKYGKFDEPTSQEIEFNVNNNPYNAIFKNKAKKTKGSINALQALIEMRDFVEAVCEVRFTGETIDSKLD